MDCPELQGSASPDSTGAAATPELRIEDPGAPRRLQSNFSIEALLARPGPQATVTPNQPLPCPAAYRSPNQPLPCSVVHRGPIRPIPRYAVHLSPIRPLPRYAVHRSPRQLLPYCAVHGSPRQPLPCSDLQLWATHWLAPACILTHQSPEALLSTYGNTHSYQRCLPPSSLWPPFVDFATHRGTGLESAYKTVGERPKRTRVMFTKEQQKELEEAFAKNHNVVGKNRAELAAQLGLREDQVRIWFQNRRVRYQTQRKQELRAAQITARPSSGGSSSSSSSSSSTQEDHQSVGEN